MLKKKKVSNVEIYFASIKLYSTSVTWTYILVVLLKGGTDVFYDFQSMNRVISFSL